MIRRCEVVIRRRSVRINDQWRLIFQWEDGNASEVQIVDYHRG